MTEIFNADEIFAIAEQIERNGIAFYQKAAERFEGEQKRRLLGLSVMEKVHQQLFAAMRRELSESDEAEKTFDPEGDAEKYLTAVAGGEIFDLNADPLQLLDRQASVRDILKLAIELEKDSIVFYLGIRQAVPEHLGKEKIEQIIKEEMDHITLLNDALSMLEE